VVDPELRRKLHERLDQLLDKRSALEPEGPFNSLGRLANLHAEIASRGIEARPLFFQAAELARDVIGEDLRNGVLNSVSAQRKQPRQMVRDWLGLVHPLLTQWPAWVTPAKITLYDVLDGLSALDAGEIQPLFKANTGKNRRANRWSLAKAKLDALVWKKRLLTMGIPEKEASFQVTVAFSEQWETIRKWKSQCEAILGPEHVKLELYFAGSDSDPYIGTHPVRTGMFANRPIDPIESLRAAGREYQRERARSAELSKRKGRTG
jgi:hypothetical protein